MNVNMVRPPLFLPLIYLIKTVLSIGVSNFLCKLFVTNWEDNRVGTGGPRAGVITQVGNLDGNKVNPLV